MKVAIFSDVQANLPAFNVAIAAIQREEPDLVIMAGDLINRGPQSYACLELFAKLQRDYGWLPIKGNHETWILRCLQEAPLTALEQEMRRFADWTAQQIQAYSTIIATWPDHLCFHGGFESSWVHVTHGSMISNRHGISVQRTDAEISAQIPLDLAVFVTAHTHRPFTRLMRGIGIINVGSVGSPFDEDPRGSYGILELFNTRWKWEIKRFEYDRIQAEREFRESGFIENGGPLAKILFEEWRLARPLMSLWRDRYESFVLAGARTLDSTVNEFLINK